jgi:hypothetical protein
VDFGKKLGCYSGNSHALFDCSRGVWRNNHIMPDPEWSSWAASSYLAPVAQFLAGVHRTKILIIQPLSRSERFVAIRAGHKKRPLPATNSLSLFLCGVEAMTMNIPKQGPRVLISVGGCPIPFCPTHSSMPAPVFFLHQAGHPMIITNFCRRTKFLIFLIVAINHYEVRITDYVYKGNTTLISVRSRDLVRPHPAMSSCSTSQAQICPSRVSGMQRCYLNCPSCPSIPPSEQCSDRWMIMIQALCGRNADSYL